MLFLFLTAKLETIPFSFERVTIVDVLDLTHLGQHPQTLQRDGVAGILSKPSSTPRDS